MSVIEVVHIKSQAGKGDEFEQRLTRGLAVQARDPECLSICFQRCVEKPDEFLLHLTWTSIAAHKAWRAAHREEWRSHIMDLIGEPANLMGHFQLVAEVKKGAASAASR